MIKIVDLESALDMLAMSHSYESEDFLREAYLNLNSGEIVYPETEDACEEYDQAEDFLELSGDIADEGYAKMEAFVYSMDEGSVKARLAKAIEGKGAFRRFKNIVFGGGDIELKHAWNWFERRRKRAQIVAWLNHRGVEPEWDGDDIFEQPGLPNKRPDLLRAT